MAGTRRESPAMPPVPVRCWREACVLGAGLLSPAVVWLHAYSNTPPHHSLPSYAQTVVLAPLLAAASVALAFRLRRRLLVPWPALAAVASAGPLLGVIVGIVRTRLDPSPNFTDPLVAALAATAGYLLGSAAFAFTRKCRALLCLPLVLGLGMGIAAYGLPDETGLAIARMIGYPHPGWEVQHLLYGHTLPS